VGKAGRREKGGLVGFLHGRRCAARPQRLESIAVDLHAGEKTEPELTSRAKVLTGGTPDRTFRGDLLIE